MRGQSEAGGTDSRHNFSARRALHDSRAEGALKWMARLSAVCETGLEPVTSPLLFQLPRVLPLREVGEIQIRARQIVVVYWQRPHKTANVLRAEWLYTGDLGFLDEDGACSRRQPAPATNLGRLP